MANPSAEAIDVEYLKKLESLDPRSKEAIIRQAKFLQENPIRVWYCRRGRACTGEPHEGADYPHARSKQWLPPLSDPWSYWFLSAGRGFGKTRTGSEAVRALSQKASRIGLVGQTTGDVRDVMIEGESGLIKAFENAGQRLEWKPSLREIVFPSGAIGKTYSAEEPDKLRGPQHALVWVDELAHFGEKTKEIWDQIRLGLRLPMAGGIEPRMIITSTPLPTPVIKDLRANPKTVEVRGSTYDNLSNLAGVYKEIVSDLEGTRKGRQELHGEILDDVDGALWESAMFEYDSFYLDELPDRDFFDRIVIAIDPAGSKNKRSDLTGIIVAGKAGDDYYVLDDHSDKYSPNEWARRVISLYEQYHADAIIAEHNFGGDMVKATVENALTEAKVEARVLVRRAVKSKQTRAEPIVGLYEQMRVHHLKGKTPELESEMVGWVPGSGPSPNRVDATVWAITELIRGNSRGSIISPRNLRR